MRRPFSGPGSCFLPPSSRPFRGSVLTHSCEIQTLSGGCSEYAKERVQRIPDRI